MSETIIVAILSLVGTVSAVIFGQRKTTALISYKIEQLEKQVHKHNQLVERIYGLEKSRDIHTEQIKVANHRIEDLEKKGEK